MYGFHGSGHLKPSAPNTSGEIVSASNPHPWCVNMQESCWVGTDDFHHQMREGTKVLFVLKGCVLP